MTRNEYVQYKLGRAKQALRMAEKLMNEEAFEDAINRIYYSIFYAVSALLYTHKLYPKSHRGMKSLFNKEFIQTRLIDKSQENFYSLIFAKRFEADYEDFFTSDSTLTQEYYKNAEKFISIIEELINTNKQND